MWCKAAGPSNVAIGLYPRKAAKREPTGGKYDTRVVVLAGTPWVTRPWNRVVGRVAERPRIMSVKKMPIESTWAEELNVAAMPAPAPRWLDGRLFIMPV